MGRFSWRGGTSTPKEDQTSVKRARKHRARGANPAGQRWADGGRCPDGVWHTGRCRH